MHLIVISLWVLAAIAAAFWFWPDYTEATPFMFGAVGAWSLSFVQRIFGGHEDD